MSARLAEPTLMGEESATPRFVLIVAITGTFLIAVGAFWLSFTTLRDLAIRSGVTPEQAWVWPLIVDGVILEATVSVVAMQQAAPAARRFAWVLLSIGAAVSVAANIVHAVLVAATEVPALVAALVASVPPLVLLAMTHLTVELARRPTPAPATVADHRNIPPDTARPLPPTPKTAEHPPAGRGAPKRSRASEPQPRNAPAEGPSAARKLAGTGLSQRKIAAQLGVHPTTVGRWLTTPDTNPTTAQETP